MNFILIYAAFKKLDSAFFKFLLSSPPASNAKIRGSESNAPFPTYLYSKKGESMLGELFKKIESTRAGFGVALLRIVIGGIFFKAGSGKLFGAFGGHGIQGATEFFQSLNIPYPAFNAVFVGCAELLGGLCLIGGLLTRLVSIPLAVTMITAIFTAHRDGDFYYPLVILCGLIALMDVGAGWPSLGRWISRKDD